MRLRRRSKVVWVVRESFFEGFWQHIIGGRREAGLAYSSTSGYYSFNEIRRMAHRAGWDFAAEALAERTQRFTLKEYAIPARVWADCLAAAGRPATDLPESVR